MCVVGRGRQADSAVFLACAEFFALDDGEQWGVAHYLFSARK